MSIPDDDSLSPLGRLLRQHAAGDPEAANAIVIHCYDRLRVLCKQKRQNFPGLVGQSESVFQELTVALLERLRKRTFDDPAHFLAYVGCMIHHQLLDRKQQKKGPGKTPPEGPDALGDIPDRAIDPAKLAARREVLEKIALLPEHHQKLFHLHKFSGLTLVQMAHELGMPLTTMKRRWHEAKIALRRLLGDDRPS